MYVLGMAKVCSHICPRPLGNTSVVRQQCENLEYVLVDRCCVNNSASSHHDTDVLGIDLSGCHLHHLNGSLLPFTSVINILLDDNPLTEKGVTDGQFYGLSWIDYLTLPPGLECPGGNESWATSNHSRSGTICEGQLDQCTIDNFTCPHHSHCLPRGPGLRECLCDNGYYGYKCLRSGDFPTEWYLVGLCSVTVAVSAFLWCTQRRHVSSKKQR